MSLADLFYSRYRYFRGDYTSRTAHRRSMLSSMLSYMGAHLQESFKCLETCLRPRVEYNNIRVLMNGQLVRPKDGTSS